MPHTPSGLPLRTLALLPLRLVLLAGVAAALPACSKINDVTGSIASRNAAPASPQPSASGPGLQKQLSEWGQRYERRPALKSNVLGYSTVLRSAGRHDQAIAILQRAVLAQPKDKELLTAYGKALADARRFPEALQVLEQAQTSERPDWSIYSTQGSIADQSGNHTLARQYYEEALKIAPGEPRVLSNLGLSFALNKQLPEAERVLRQASAHPRADMRIRQNLSLVLALQGKFDEAEQVQRQVSTPEEARANVAAIRSMISQSNTWREIQRLDEMPAARRPARPSRQRTAANPANR